MITQRTEKKYVIWRLQPPNWRETTVRYATEGLSLNLFVSKYKLQLPTEEEIRNYLIEKISKEDYEEYKNNL